MQPSSAGMFFDVKPYRPISMMTISRLFTKRISVALSNLSASWPLVAEKSRKGRMKSAAISCTTSAGSRPLALAVPKVTITVKANLKRLSLPAPRNCAQKNGANRRWPSRAN